MAAAGQFFRFGRFELDAGRRRLTRDGENLYVPDRPLDALIVLVKNKGRFVSKHTIVEEAWRGIAVTDNALVQAIKALRELLGSKTERTTYIETKARHGYRFVMPVEDARRENLSTDIKELFEHDREFVTARAALETMDRNAVETSRRLFAGILSAEPDNVPAKIGMGMAGFLDFESTRVDSSPATKILLEAERHVREACNLDPRSAEAWSTLALIRGRCGDALEAVAAARKAVTLEPDAWLHHVRLASVSWGNDRLRAANRALAINDQHALGYWFTATVFVARQNFEPALEALRAGCALQDGQQQRGTASSQSGRQGWRGRFAASGLHWLHGLVLWAMNRQDDALAEFERERAFEPLGHVYAREACANSWYATGAVHLCAGRHDEAVAAFREALTRVPCHASAAAAIGRYEVPSAGPPRARGAEPALTVGRTSHPQRAIESADATMACAASLALQQKHEEAARLCGALLQRAEPGSVAWLLPVEPLLRPTAHRAEWASALATLRARAL